MTTNGSYAELESKESFTDDGENEKLSCREKLSYAAPTTATLPFITMFGIYGNKYYESFGASLAMIALFTALARSMDIVTDPVMSYITDSSECGSHGRRRPYMFIGCFLYSGIIYCLLNPPYAGEAMLSLWYGVFSTLFAIVATFTIIPYDALGPELSEDSEERTSVFFTSNLFDGVGLLVALILPFMMVEFSNGQKMNDWVCMPEHETVNMCLQGRSCGDFLHTGSDAAFQPNETLLALLGAGINETLVVGPDASKRCINFSLDYNLTRMNLLGENMSLVQNVEFCNCVAACNGACDVADKRTGFRLVGIAFAVWFVITMLNCVYQISERPPRPRPTQALLPSLRSTFNNWPFRVLMPAWICDALGMALVAALVPFFVEAVVAPEYMTMEKHGVDCHMSSPDYEGGKYIGLAGQSTAEEFNPWQCRSSNVMAMCMVTLLVTALLALPAWNLAVKCIGKTRAWLWWSILNAITNLGFLFINQGDIMPLVFLCALNGLPVGAKFLADSILSDIIDYDEFLTGQRREATYFMFKSFLPKIVMIPASALPLAFLGVFGYRPPVGGKPALQPGAVGYYIKGAIFMGFIASVISIIIKSGFPMREEDVPVIRSGIELQKEGKAARDPLRNDQPSKPIVVEEGLPMKLYTIIGHFDPKYLQDAFELPSLVDEDSPPDVPAGVAALKSLTLRHLLVAVFLVIVSSVVTGVTMPLLFNENLQFVPTLSVIVGGISFTVMCACILRRKAALELEQLAEDGEVDPDIIERLIRHEELVRYEEVGVPEDRTSLLNCCTGVEPSSDYDIVVNDDDSISSLDYDPIDSNRS